MDKIHISDLVVYNLKWLIFWNAMCMGLDQYNGESLNYDLCGSGDGGYAVSGCLISARIPLAAIRRVMKFRENLDKKI